MTLRTVPIRLAPVEGEGLDSYLEALACRSGTAWGDVIDAVGLGAPMTPSRPGIYPWVRRLTGSQSTALSQSTGVDIAALAQMTLAGFMPTAIRTPLVPLLLSPSRSRFCPLCLAVDGAGRWQLWWRLRWSFACPRHSCLLADCCPACGLTQRTQPLPSWLIPQTGTCARSARGASGRDLTRCGAVLSTHLIDPLPGEAVIAAQTRLLQYVRQESVCDGIYRGQPVTVPQFLADLTALANRILNYAERSELQSRLPAYVLDLGGGYLNCGLDRTNTAAAAVSIRSVRAAVGVVCALDVLEAADLSAAGERLRWLVRCSRRRGEAVSASNIGWGKHVSAVLRGAQLGALEPFLGPSDQLRYRSGSVLPRHPQPAPIRHRHVPALLWAPAAHGFTVNRVGSEQLRSALATAVLIAGTPTSLSRGAELLGSITTAVSVSRVLQALRAGQKWCAVRTAILAIADVIDHADCPIDYGARRALPFDRFLPVEDWREICRDTATPPGENIKIRLVRSWMYQRLIGSPAQCAPGAFTGGEHRDKLAKLVRGLTPELVDRLDHYARGFLDHHGRGGEPLYWSIPEPLLAGCGIEMADSVDIAKLHRIVRDPALTLTEVAQHMATTLDGVLEILGSRPAPLPLLDQDQRRARGGAFAAAKAQLPYPKLSELYERQGLGIAEIASRTGTSRQTVRRLAGHYGIVVRNPGRPREL
jgi:TniQ